MYKVITKNKYFNITAVGTKTPIVEVRYQSIWNSNANFNLGKDTYEIKSNNSWQTKFDILKNEIDVGDIDFNWKGEIIIRIKNKESVTKHFVLKLASIWTNVFELKDFTTNLLWTIKPKFEWTKMRYSFLVTRENGFEQNKSELLFEDDDSFILIENHVNEIELLVCTVYASILYINAQAAAAS